MYNSCFFIQEDGVNHGNESTLSALDEDDFQTIIIENKLGCDIYLKTFEHNSENVELLLPDDSTPTWVPPPRFSVRLNHADESREARYYIAVNIIEAKVFSWCMQQLVLQPFTF